MALYRTLGGVYNYTVDVTHHTCITTIPRGKIALSNTLPRDTFTVINDRTGELVLRSVENVTTRHGTISKTEERFARVFNETLKIVVRSELTKTELRVLLCCIAWSDFENYIDISRKKMAAELDIDPTNVSHAVKTLLRLGFLCISTGEGGVSKYRLSAQLCWSGDAKLRKKYQRQTENLLHQEMADNLFASGITSVV